MSYFMNIFKDQDSKRKQSHSQIEKRRRIKIQATLDKLSKLVPGNANQNNLHKLQILENTVLYIEEMQRKQTEKIEGPKRDQSHYVPSLICTATPPLCPSSPVYHNSDDSIEEDRESYSRTYRSTQFYKGILEVQRTSEELFSLPPMRYFNGMSDSRKQFI
jgi:hypothetical protein